MNVTKHELAHGPLPQIDLMYDLNPPHLEREPFPIGETSKTVLSGYADSTIVVKDDEGREISLREILSLKFVYMLVVPDPDQDPSQPSGQLLAPGTKLKYSTRTTK